MPELHDRFDYQAVLEAVEQPAFDELRLRARRHNRRTALVVSAAAALAVLAAIGVPAVLRPEPAPTRPAAPPVGKPWPVPSGGKLYGPKLQFLDARHGYASYDLHSGFDVKTCGSGVRQTTDGGQTWSEMRGIPCRATGSLFRGELVVVGKDVLIRYPTNRIQDKHPYISFDAGRTWSVHQVRTRTAQSFPDGVRPYRVCRGGVSECAEDNRLEWWDPKTGDLVRLANGPDMGALRGGMVGTDGSFWIAGYAKDGRWAAAVTRDNGRTWATRAMSIDGEPLEGPVVATYDGRLGYLVAAGEGTDSAGNRYPYSIFRTLDGGETWTRADTKAIPAKHFGVFEALVAADGTLLIPDSDGPWYASQDGGETFTRAEYLEGIGWMSCVTGMCYARKDDQWHASNDLMEWRPLNITG